MESNLGKHDVCISPRESESLFVYVSLSEHETKLELMRKCSKTQFQTKNKVDFFEIKKYFGVITTLKSKQVFVHLRIKRPIDDGCVKLI